MRVWARDQPAQIASSRRVPARRTEYAILIQWPPYWFLKANVKGPNIQAQTASKVSGHDFKKRPISRFWTTRGFKGEGGAVFLTPMVQLISNLANWKCLWGGWGSPPLSTWREYEHRLPIKRRIQYKIVLLAYMCLYDLPLNSHVTCTIATCQRTDFGLLTSYSSADPLCGPRLENVHCHLPP